MAVTRSCSAAGRNLEACKYIPAYEYGRAGFCGSAGRRLATCKLNRLPKRRARARRAPRRCIPCISPPVQTRLPPGILPPFPYPLLPPPNPPTAQPPSNIPRPVPQNPTQVSTAPSTPAVPGAPGFVQPSFPRWTAPLIQRAPRVGDPAPPGYIWIIDDFGYEALVPNNPLWPPRAAASA